MKSKNSVWAHLIAIILIVAAIVYGLCIDQNKNYIPDIVVFGDSLVGNDRSENSVTGILSKISGKEVFNAGVGGSLMTKGNTAANPLHYFNMVNLSKVILENNCGALTAMISDDYLKLYDVIYYVKDTSRQIETVDFKSVETIVIEQGTNDMLLGISAEEYGDALERSIINLRKINPTVKIVVVSPGYVAEDCVDENISSVEEYIEIGERVALENSAMYVDFYHDSGIDKNNYTRYLYDGLHTNAEGNEILGNLIWTVINEEDKK